MKKLSLIALLALFSSIASAQAIFQYYGPAAGIQKNTGSTFQNTSAASSDVVGLFSGCSGVLLLGADGACHSATATPGGSNTNVQINNSGSFGGFADFSWITGTDTMLLGSTSLAPTVTTNATTATGTGITLTVDGGPGGSTSGNGGTLNLNGGAANQTTGTTGNGGTLNITGGPGAVGSAATTGNGGNVVISGGLSASATVTGDATGNGGNVSLLGGNTNQNNNTSYGSGGNVTITGGSAGSASGGQHGGNITITGGTSLNGADSPGTVTIASGSTGTQGLVTIHSGQSELLLQQQGTPEWQLGNDSTTGNRLTGTASGGVQLGAPTGGDCGAGCFNAQSVEVNGVAVSTVPGANTDIVYNNSGVLGANSDFTFNGTTTVTLGTTSSGTLVANNAATVTSTGAQLRVNGGPGGSTSGTGGNLVLSGGSATEGNGGQSSLNGGSAGTATSGNHNGGNTSVAGGLGVGTGNGGVVTVQGGTGGLTGPGGGVTIEGGNGGGTSGNTGNVVLLIPAPTSGTAGNILLEYQGNTGFTFSGTDGGMTAGSPTGGDKGTGTINATGLFVNGTAVSVGSVTNGSDTITLATGCTTTPSVTATWVKSAGPSNYSVTYSIPHFTCTATGSPTQLTFTGFSNSSTGDVGMVALLENNSATVQAYCQMNSSTLECSQVPSTTFTNTVGFGSTIYSIPTAITFTSN